MNMKLNIKLYSLVLLLATTFFFAQGGPPCPTCPYPGGGVGGTTPGAVTSPIDMYVYVLAIIAVCIAAYYGKKYKVQSA